MSGKKRSPVFLYTVMLILVLVSVLIFWLRPSNSQQTLFSPTSQSDQQAHDANQPSQITQHQTAPVLSPSQQDTEINCQLQLDASHRLIVNAQTRDCFEYFISQYGEANLDEIKAHFITYAQHSYQQPALAQIIDLWTRYIEYRKQLGELKPPAGDPQSAQYLREIFADTENLRKKFFSTAEIAGLFNTQNVYDQYTLDRMAILEQTTLSEAEKAKQLNALFQDLPQDWQENIQQLSVLEDLRQLTAALKARGGTANELRQMRLNLVGADATNRLEHLDVERQDWKGRVNQYLTDRDSILNSGLSESGKQQAIAQLQTQQFATQQEQLRLQTFESIHDKGGTLPFVE
ncbi:lipase secretion chaperone [Acinetobacter puyangensis]|uniref:lipase secretion chaperone n=1 Tax=Acinetobacter puyangensis TaxID=1096779 RepID=UPI003A4DAF43